MTTRQPDGPDQGALPTLVLTQLEQALADLIRHLQDQQGYPWDVADAPTRPLVAAEGAGLQALAQVRALLAGRSSAATHVTAVVPDYAVADFQRQQYGPWYIAHPDPAQLAPEVLQAHYATGVAGRWIRPDAPERMAAFADYLEAHGFTVYDTAGDGYVTLTTGAPPPV
jgi:hypothetical protein